LILVTVKPIDLSSKPVLEAMMPLPTPDMTPISPFHQRRILSRAISLSLFSAGNQSPFLHGSDDMD